MELALKLFLFLTLLAIVFLFYLRQCGINVDKHQFYQVSIICINFDNPYSIITVSIVIYETN